MKPGTLFIFVLAFAAAVGCHHRGAKGHPGYVEITSRPVEMAVVGKTYRYQVDAYTTLGCAITYTLEEKPGGMTLSGTGALAWTPSENQSGWSLVTVMVTDSQNEKRQHFKINVLQFTGKNHAPVITSAPGEFANTGELYQYDVNATDIDDDGMTFELAYTEHDGMAIDPATGVISWTPGAELAGDRFDVIVVVRDNVTEDQGFDEQEFSITVVTKPGAPEILSPAVTTAHVGRAYSYRVAAVDPDGDVLSYMLAAAPAGMAVNSATGLIAWTPGGSQLGNHGVILRITDGTYTTVQNYTVEVLPGDAVRFLTAPPVNAWAGVECYYAPEVTREAGASLAYTLVTAPGGMNVDNAHGTLTWTPGGDDLGYHAVVLQAHDGTHAARQSFLVEVLAADAPRLARDPVTFAYAGETYTFLAEPAGCTSVTLAIEESPAGMSLNSESGLLTWIPAPEDAGDHLVRLSLAGGSAEAALVYTLRVLPADGPRFLSSPPSEPVSAGETYAYTFEFDNAGVEPVEFYVSRGPSGASVDGGVFAWTPDASHAGTNVFHLDAVAGVYHVYEVIVVTVTE